MWREFLYVLPYCPRSGSRTTNDAAFDILALEQPYAKNTILLCDLNYNDLILDFGNHNLQVEFGCT